MEFIIAVGTDVIIVVKDAVIVVLLKRMAGDEVAVAGVTVPGHGGRWIDEEELSIWSVSWNTSEVKRNRLGTW